MDRLRSVAAVVLLAAFAVGGLGAPVLHELAHAGEAAETVAHRTDAADHHHHTAEDAHGAEVLPPCPDALDAALACALCVATSASIVDAPAGLVAPQAQAADAQFRPEPPARPAHSAHGARGPPALV